MINIFGGLTIGSGVKFIADFFSVIYGMFGRTIVNTVLNIFALVWNFITKWVWLVCKWVLGMLDAMQFGFTRLLGIETSAESTMTFDDLIEGAKDVVMPGGNSYYDYIMKIFRATFGVAIVLMIIFTIVAMVLQEYNLAVNGYAKADNQKGKFVKVIFTNIITIFLLPLIFYTVITGTSAILTSFYRALGTTTDVTIAGNVLAATTHDANRYRAYANANKRIPITISVYDMENAFGGAKGDAELLTEINKREVQNTLMAIAGAFSNDSFLPFEKSTVYDNGVWANYENYSLTYNNTVYDDLGGYFENFICTREQYYVMADFIDYCQLYNIDYYVKAMSESDICWKYVDYLTVDEDEDGKDADIDKKGNALGDITLKIKYRDAATINMENAAKAAASEDDSYELQITTKMDYSSPISDALTTASKLLGIDGDTSKFNTMERDDTGDFTNLVNWSTEKVLLKFSQNFDITKPNTWTFSDQIIVYEYYHFQAAGESSNNTLQNYTINDFAFNNDGVKLNALQMKYRNYNSNTQSYSEEHTEYCVKMNGNYYRVKKSDSEFDAYGHAYYILDVIDEHISYFDKDLDVKIQKVGTINLQLSPGFSINDAENWTTLEQILIYEYFKDFTLSNDLVKKYRFMDFQDGVDFNTFKIGSKYYVYINGTYYQLDNSGTSLPNSDDFLLSTSAASRRFFGYTLKVLNDGKSDYGILSNLDSYKKSISDSSFIEIDDTDAIYQKYSSMNFRLSEDFSFANSDTWSFRDYVLIYLYVKTLYVDSSINMDSLKHLGLQGTYGRVGSTYYIQVKYIKEGEAKYAYYDVEALSETSELKITQTLDPEVFDNMNLGLTGVDLVTTYNADISTDKLVEAELSTHTFTLSENFDQYDPESWSIGDYLMICLTNAGIIDTDIGMIELQGYTSLVYDIDGTKYYRFGKEGDEDAFFLNEEQVEAANYDVDKWFKTDLMSFMLTRYYNAAASDLVFDEETFGGGVYINKDNYILDVDGDVTATKSLQNKLAKELFDKGVASGDISKLEYSYYNPEIKTEDITTWKYLDLMIYQRTGRVPTASQPYTSYIYKSGTYWFLIKDSKSADNDIFVNISGIGSSQCMIEDGEVLTYQIRSENKKSFSTVIDFKTYYTQYIQTKAMTMGSPDFKAYYYSDSLKGTGSASFEANKLYSDVDMVLVQNGKNKSPTGYYTFDGYKDGDNIYIEIIEGSCYLGLGPSSSDRMYFKSNSITPSTAATSAPMFKDNGNVYTSFDVNKTKFDALLQKLTGSTAQNTYTIYEYGSHKYIKVNNNYVKLDADLVDAEPDDVTESTTNIDYLFNNYYFKYVTETAPVITSTYAGNLSLTETWHTGIQIILKHYGIEATHSNSALVITNTDERYLRVNGTSETIYIKLAELATSSYVESAASGGYNVTIVSTDAETVKWRLNNVEPTYIENDDSLVNTTLVKIASTMSSSLDVTGAPDLLKTHEVENYTYLNLLSVYFDPYNNNKRLNIFYCIDEGRSYVMFENFGDKYIVSIWIKYVSVVTNANVEAYITDSIVRNVDAPESILEEQSIDLYSDLATDHVIGSMVYEKGYSLITKYRSHLTKDETGDPLVFYIAEKDGKHYSIYGLKNELLSSTPIGYLKIEGIDSFDEVSDEADASIFVVSTRDMDKSSEWSMVDFTVSYLLGNVHGAYFGSYVYEYGSKRYVESEGKYILIPYISSEDVFRAHNTTEGLVDSTGSRKLIDLLGEFVKQRSSLGGIELQLTAFEETELAEYDEGESAHIKFSEGFDVRNFGTWTMADYILYYVISNGYYEDGATLNIPFTYIPNYMSSGVNVSNLTYFDMFLADAYKDGNEYPYFTEEEYKNKVYNLYVIRDNTYNYYIQVKDNYYVKLSDFVSTNYKKMEIVSTLLGGTYSTENTDEIKAKLMELDPYKKTSISGTKVTLSSTIEGKNFQTLANSHGTLGQIHYLLKQDPDTGSVQFNKVIEFNSESGKSGTYFKYDKFFELYGSSFESYAATVKQNELDIVISHSKPGGVDYALEVKYDQIFPDLEFKNYYYFIENADAFESSTIASVEQSAQKNILASVMEGINTLDRAQVALKLSTNFNIEDTSTWTVIDFVIMREYAREGINHNKFKDMSFEELKEETYAIIYLDGDNYYLYLNGNFYNLKGAVKLLSGSGSDAIYVADEAVKLPSGIINGTDATVNDYNIRVLKETLDFSISSDYNKSATYTRDVNNISYVIGNEIIFRYLDTNVVNANFRINVSRFGMYSTETLIKKSSWVEKLMNDMQVFYPDLNWSTLIATDGWLDTLGDFTSAYTNGLILGGDNSSNTTAAGLVLSEFFMSVATEVTDSYADYEYSSVFDEETIQALMLSLMGEENYNALVFEAEVFMDFFNSTFAPIIDDFAEEFGETIGENSLRLCAYKSYLATVLLSSDIGEYLYTIATRIYAEYTIGEYLANAGGDYAGYYSYVNNLKDEDGNTVDAFNYGKFVDLVRYENEYCGKNNPVFTFNVKNAFDIYKDDDDEVSGIKYEDAKDNESKFNTLVNALVKKMDKDYEKIYSNNYQINEQGLVIDDKAELVTTYEDKEFPYCYMLHVYWEIEIECRSSSEYPSYLTAYRAYIDDNLRRWEIISDESIEGADMYFETVKQDQNKMKLYRALSFANCVRLFIPGIALGGNDDDGLLDKIKQLLKFLEDVVNPFDQTTILSYGTLPILNAYDMARENSKVIKALDFVRDHSLSLYFVMGFSEDSAFKISDFFKDVIDFILPVDLSPETSWNTVLEFNDSLDIIITELQDIRALLPGEKTEGGSTRAIVNGATGEFYTDAQIDKILTSYQDLQFNVDQYVAAQQRLDQMQKRAITFTLAQYGTQYVSSGYQFNVRNKDYTFKNTVDPSRIAEYVYGGAFLEKVGVGAQYTHPEFTGIVTASKVYDNVDKVLKTHLVTWPQLRGFASNIADKTAELYFLTNLGDLDVGKVNGIEMDDSLSNGSIADDVADFITEQFTANLGGEATSALIERIGDDFASLSLYLFSGSIEEEDLEGITFEEYKRMVLKRIILNEQNEEESAEERANKYMTLFNMLGLQYELSSKDGPSDVPIGRIVYSGNLIRNGNDVQYSKPGYAAGDIKKQRKISNSTIDVVKSMSGLENRPTFEVLTREYSGLRPTDYFDEAYGDSFVICTYKDGLYYPILASGSKVCDSDNFNAFYDLKGAEGSVLKHKFVSEYLGEESYVIVAKGVITADGYPTGIRKYNNPIEVAKKKLLRTSTETFNAVTYYRTNVGGTFGEGNDLVNASRAVNRVTTKNYTKYVYGTNYTGGIGGTTTYTGRTNLKTFVSSDYEAKFVQSKVEYLLGESNDFGGISVLNDFSYFYVFGGQTWILLVMSFITIIPVMINALGGVISRIFDLVILFIVSPLVISTNSLFPGGKNDIFKKWKKNVESVLWSALGYIIGFSSFTILVPVVYNINSFVDPSTFTLIQSIGGLGKFIKLPVVDGLVRALWIVTAVSVLERMPKLLLPVLTANHGDLNSPHPGLGGGGKKFTDKAKEVGGTLKDVAKKMGSVVSGRALLGAVQKVKSDALSMIPGYDQMKSFKEKVIDPVANAVGNAIVEMEKKAIQIGLQAYGVDPMTAKAAGEAVGAVHNSRMKAKQDIKKKNEEYKKEFEEFTK